MFAANGDLDLQDQDHLKYVILKIMIRSPKHRDFEDQDHAQVQLQTTDYLCSSRSKLLAK